MATPITLMLDAESNKLLKQLQEERGLRTTWVINKALKEYIKFSYQDCFDDIKDKDYIDILEFMEVERGIKKNWLINRAFKRYCRELV